MYAKNIKSSAKREIQTELKKSQYLNSIFQLNFTKYKKKVMIQNCLLHKDLQV